MGVGLPYQCSVVIAAFIGTLLVAPKVAGDGSRPWDLLSSVLALAALLRARDRNQGRSQRQSVFGRIDAALLVHHGGGLPVRPATSAPAVSAARLLDFRNPAFSLACWRAAVMFALGDAPA